MKKKNDNMPSMSDAFITAPGEQEKPRATTDELIIQPKQTEYGPLETIRRAMETIEAEKAKLKDERARLQTKIDEIDYILGTPTTPVSKHGVKTSGGNVSDRILSVLATGPKTVKELQVLTGTEWLNVAMSKLMKTKQIKDTIKDYMSLQAQRAADRLSSRGVSGEDILSILQSAASELGEQLERIAGQGNSLEQGEAYARTIFGNI